MKHPILTMQETPKKRNDEMAVSFIKTQQQLDDFLQGAEGSVLLRSECCEIWVPISLVSQNNGGASNSWLLGGNTGLTDLVDNMIGTKDATPLVFWQNDAEVGRIDVSNIALGLNAFVSNYKSVSIGVSASASGPQCIAIGLESKALQDFGIAVGMNAEAQMVNSISIGALTRTKGDFSTAIGVGAFSFSFDEVQFQKGTDYGALSASDAQPTDRKFNIGNHDYITGTAHDVFTILKNGQTAIGGFDNFETTTNPAQLQVNGSIASNTIISAAYLGSNANGEIIAVAAPVATLTGINQYKQFTATAAQTAFTLPTTPLTGSDVVMYRNGISQSNTTYTVTGTAVTYTGVALTIGDRINFQYTK